MIRAAAIYGVSLGVWTAVLCRRSARKQSEYQQNMSSSDDGMLVHVIDHGTAFMRCGTGGHDAPDHIECVANSGYHKNGLIVDWQKAEQCWTIALEKHASLQYLENGVSGESVLSLVHQLTPRRELSRMGQLYFETFDTEQFCIEASETASVMASGRLTALVLDQGYSSTSAMAVYEGTCFGVARRDPFGVADISDFTRPLGEFKCDFTRLQAFAWTSPNDETAIYQLPDGTPLDSKREVSEMLINPWQATADPQALFGKFPIRGAAGLVHDVLTSLPLDVKVGHWGCGMYNNIVVAGGATMTANYPECLQTSLEHIYHQARVQVIAPPERSISSWIGGSIFSSLGQFRSFSRAQYHEYGDLLAARSDWYPEGLESNPSSQMCKSLFSEEPWRAADYDEWNSTKFTQLRMEFHQIPTRNSEAIPSHSNFPLDRSDSGIFEQVVQSRPDFEAEGAEITLHSNSPPPRIPNLCTHVHASDALWNLHLKGNFQDLHLRDLKCFPEIMRKQVVALICLRQQAISAPNPVADASHNVFRLMIDQLAYNQSKDLPNDAEKASAFVMNGIGQATPWTGHSSNSMPMTAPEDSDSCVGQDLSSLSCLKLKQHLISAGIPKGLVDRCPGKPTLLHLHSTFNHTQPSCWRREMLDVGIATAPGMMMPQLLDQDAKAFFGEHAESLSAFDVMKMEHKSACDIRPDFDECNRLICQMNDSFDKDRLEIQKIHMKKLTDRARLNDSFVSRCLPAFTLL